MALASCAKQGALEGDRFWMRQALQEAHQAAQQGEVPVGAVLVEKNCLLAAAGNQPLKRCDPTAHAEIIALRKGATLLRSDRLVGTTLYVTLEPCLMCLGAMLHARINRLVFAAYDPRAGAAGSVFNCLQTAQAMWRPDVIGGLFEEEAGKLLRDFFAHRR